MPLKTENYQFMAQLADQELRGLCHLPVTGPTDLLPSVVLSICFGKLKNLDIGLTQNLGRVIEQVSSTSDGEITGG